MDDGAYTTRSRRFVLAGAVVLVAWSAAAAWLAIPRHDICPAIYPAPAGCRAAGRVPVALVLAGVLGAAFVGLAAAILRWRENRWLGWAAVGALAVGALLAYWRLRYS